MRIKDNKSIVTVIVLNATKSQKYSRRLFDSRYLKCSTNVSLLCSPMAFMHALFAISGKASGRVDLNLHHLLQGCGKGKHKSNDTELIQSEPKSSPQSQNYTRSR